jgi:hypothetical protein
MLLTGADVDDGGAQVSAFPHAHAGVTDQHASAPQNGQELTSWQVSDEVDILRVVVFAVFAEPLRQGV